MLRKCKIFIVRCLKTQNFDDFNDLNDVNRDFLNIIRVGKKLQIKLSEVINEASLCNNNSVSCYWKNLGNFNSSSKVQEVFQVTYAIHA